MKKLILYIVAAIFSFYVLLGFGIAVFHLSYQLVSWLPWLFTGLIKLTLLLALGAFVVYAIGEIAATVYDNLKTAVRSAFESILHALRSAFRWVDKKTDELDYRIYCARTEIVTWALKPFVYLRLRR
jgi:hypothetical protein